jgi:ATP-binding cassette, subfamily B, bacterial
MSSMGTETRSHGRILFRFVPFFRPYLLWIFLVLFGGLGAAAMRLVSPYLLLGLTDSAFQGQRNAFSQYLQLAVVAVLASFLLNILNQVAFSRFHTQVIRDLRLKLTAHIQRLPVGYLDSIHTGDLVSRLNTDLQKVADLLRTTMQSLAQPFLFFLAFGYCLTILRGSGSLLPTLAGL